MMDKERGIQSTRQEILTLLKQQGGATVDDLAQRLGLTPMTIRHHLNVLQAQNLVMTSEIRRLQSVGRPRLVYALTEAAEELFPQGYGELASQLLSEVKTAIGPDKTRDLLAGVAERIAREAPPSLDGQTFEQRLDQVARFLGKLGFLITWEKTADGYVLTNANCPYRRVSQKHAEVCAMDAALFRRLLGVEPRYVALVRDGSAACTCLLTP